MKCPSKRVSACAQLEIYVVKLGSICENKTDLDEKRIFNFKLSKKSAVASFLPEKKW